MKGQTYHYVCENRWDDGKVKQRTVAYLGRYKTVHGAYRHFQAMTHDAETAQARSKAKRMLKRLEPYLKEHG